MIPLIVGVSEKVLVPVPYAEANGCELQRIPVVVKIFDPPVTEISWFTKIEIVVIVVAPTESVAVIVSIYGVAR